MNIKVEIAGDPDAACDIIDSLGVVLAKGYCRIDKVEEARPLGFTTPAHPASEPKILKGGFFVEPVLPEGKKDLVLRFKNGRQLKLQKYRVDQHGGDYATHRFTGEAID